jgi:hypothetical protein
MSTSPSPRSSSLSKRITTTSRAGRTRVALSPNDEVAEVSPSKQSNSSTTEVPSRNTSPAANEKTSTTDNRATACTWSLVRTLRKRSTVTVVPEDGSGLAKKKTKELMSSTNRRSSGGVPIRLLRIGASTPSLKVGPSRRRSASKPSSEAAMHGISDDLISEISATLAGLGKSMESQQAVLGELKASIPKEATVTLTLTPQPQP